MDQQELKNHYQLGLLSQNIQFVNRNKCFYLEDHHQILIIYIYFFFAFFKILPLDLSTINLA